MAKHKWHDEIVAWAGGAEIEFRQFQFVEYWQPMQHNIAIFDNESFQFRIKPQPKQPKYLYVYKICGKLELSYDRPIGECIGKIEVNDD